MTDIPLAFWRSKPKHEPNIMAFERLVRELRLDLTWPNRKLAPWHVQTVVGTDTPNPQVINLWPHQLKAYWSGCKAAVKGKDDIRDLILRAERFACERPAVVFYDDCPACNGTGELDFLAVGRDYGDPDGIYECGRCDACDGTGEIEVMEDEE